MTDELKFSKESLSFVRVVSAPANIVCAMLSSYLASEKPFKLLYYVTLFCVLIRSYSVLVLVQYFPTDPIEQQSPNNILHMTIITLLKELSDNFHFTTCFAIVANIVDKRITGIHCTLLACAINMSSFSHKFYLFSLVDLYGIFVPQIFLSVLSVFACLYYQEIIFQMDNLQME